MLQDIDSRLERVPYIPFGVHVRVHADLDVLCIGNAIVDVLCRVEDAAIEQLELNRGTMTLIDAARAEALYARMGPAVEASGGRFLDLHRALRKADFRDHLGHYSEQGTQILAAKLQPVVEKLLFAPESSR